MNQKKKFIDFTNSKRGINVTKNYTGCVSINLYNSKNNQNKLIMIQTWNSMYHKKLYLKMREKEGTHDFFKTLVKTPLELDIITPINLNSKL